MKKSFFTMMLVLAAMSTISQAAFGESYWRGNGGKNMSVAIHVPEGRGLTDEQDYLPSLVQGVFVADFKKYSAISVLDRQNLEKVLREAESGIYAEGADVIELGRITQTSHMLSGSVTRTTTGYSFSVTVADTRTGTAKASYSGTCTIEEFDNFSGIKKASLELLTQMGVQLTDAAKAELSGAAGAEQVNAQIALARGITAQKRGDFSLALMNYYEANAYDPKYGDNAEWLKSLSDAVKGGSLQTAVKAKGMTGSIRSEIENELARREYERQLQERWQTILSGAAGYVRDYFRTYKPAAVVYDPNIRHRVANYENAVVELSFTARAVVFSKKEMPLFKMLKDLEAGLERAQKGKEWHIDFVQAVLGGNVYGYGDNSFTFTYTVEGVVLNAAGVEIHRFSTPLQTKIAALEVTRQTKNGARLRSSAIVFCEYPAEPKVLEQTVSFQTPLADVTDDMTIQITAVYESEGGENLIDEEKLIKVKILEGILSSQTPLAAEMADDMMRQITAESGENLIAVIPVMTEGKWALRAGFRAAKAPEYERFRIGVSVDGGVLYGSSYPDIDGDKEQPGGGHTHFSNYQAGLYARLGAEAGIRSLFAETGITFNPNNTSSGKLFYYNGHWGHGASSLLRGNPLVTLFEAGAGYRFFWQRKRQVDNQWFWGTGLNLSGGVAFMSAEDAPALVTTGMDSNVTTTTTTVEGYNGMALYLGVKLFNDTPRHYYPMNDISGFALNSTLRRMYMSLRLYIPLAAPEHTRVAWGFGWMFYPVRM